MNDYAAHFLLVEDDEVDIRAVKRAFRKLKLTNSITVASDGIEALEILRGENGRDMLPKPYLILLDLNMPRMNGIQFLEELRNDPNLRTSVVFVFTTSNAERDKLAVYEKNVAGYLLKSRSGSDILDALKLLENFSLTIQFPPNTEDFNSPTK